MQTHLRKLIQVLKFLGVILPFPSVVMYDYMYADPLLKSLEPKRRRTRDILPVF